jgi:N-acetylglucosamine-6-phosphate deacetylase
MRLGVEAAVVDGQLVPGDVELADGLVAEVGLSRGRRGSIAVPGFVDLQVNGFAGVDFLSAAREDYETAGAALLATGVTAFQPTFICAPEDVLVGALREVPADWEGPRVVGAHLEGPFLSPFRLGTHPREYRRDPDLELLDRLLDAGPVTEMTIAPELPGAAAAIAVLREHGVLAAIGHTDATYEQTLAGVAAGATLGTHLFNGMRPPHHREPGPVIALLGAKPVVCELIADGIHLHPGMLAFAARTAGPDRAALITDAMDAAGMPDGRYELGGQQVTVAERVARLARNGSIAGSTLTMDAALRQAVAAGVALPDASAMASTTPARVLGLDDRVGALEAGLRADLVVLSPDLHVTRVMRAGAWI